MENFSEHENLIEQYLIEGNKDAAVQLLSELIVKTAMKFKRSGTVVAVNSEPFNEYIVHAEFAKNLDPLDLDELEELIEPRED